ncbi:MAG TPA: hypothetical protein VFB99_02565 [Vicinamibacterales bacterium]|nr:hypothetical protein [Vicinamibacterales bacterium]
MRNTAAHPALVKANVFGAFVDDTGVLALDAPKAFKQYVAAKFKGRDVTITIARKRRQRSLDQNGYWWAVPVQILADELGYTPSQMHYTLLGEYGGYLPGLKRGTVMPKIASSSELSTVEFAALIDWVLDWAPSELNIVIPPPDPEWRQRRALEAAREAVAS